MLVSTGWLGLSVFGMPNALLPLTNLTRVSLVPSIVASLWSGAPSSIMCQCSSWMSPSNNMCLRVTFGVLRRTDSRWALVYICEVRLRSFLDLFILLRRPSTIESLCIERRQEYIY